MHVQTVEVLAELDEGLVGEGYILLFAVVFEPGPFPEAIMKDLGWWLTNAVDITFGAGGSHWKKIIIDEYF